MTTQTVPGGEGLSVAPHDVRSLVGTVLAERYELYSVLGRGGTGIVMAARDRTLGSDVAIKVLRPELASDRRWIERLSREVKVARQLHHPNVCPAFDLERADGHAFIVMPLAAGSLRGELSGQGAARPLEDRLRDAAGFAAGLAAIHERGIVHRDLSSQNVLRMKTGHLALSDFGLAIEADRTAASMEGGTFAYMAPELTLGGRASFASDLWAAGIIIHEIVFGDRPSWRDGVVRKGISRPAGRLSPGEEELLTLCRRCTAEQPAARGTSSMLVDSIARIGVRPTAGGHRRRLRISSVLALIALCTFLGLLRVSRRRTAPPSKANPELDVLTLDGHPEDWTASAPVVAEVPGRVQCMTVLPDGHTLRFVWGSDPRIAQDVDIRTRRMIRSPIEPRTYRHVCPSLSPDGRHLLFEDYDTNGRAAIYSSDQPDGSRPYIVAMTDDMRGGSEAKWLASGTAIVMDIDQQHGGIMDLSSNHMTVLPRQAYPHELLAGWMAGGDWAMVLTVVDGGRAYLDGYHWPEMTKSTHAAIELESSDLQTYDGATIYGNDQQRSVVAIRPREQTMERLGEIPGQFIGHLSPAVSGLGFVSFTFSSDLYVMREGKLHAVTTRGDTWGAARCGSHGFLLATRATGYQSMKVVRLDEHGVPSVVADRGSYGAVACDRTGHTWWYGREEGDRSGLVRCTPEGCSELNIPGAIAVHLSPDESRLVLLVYTVSGPRVQWISAKGGGAHDVAPSETICAPGWASNSALWVSRKLHDSVYWTQVDADTGQETGPRLAGGHDCNDTDPDPSSPVDPDMRIIVHRVSQIRWKDFAQSGIGAGPQSDTPWPTPSGRAEPRSHHE